MMLNVWIQILKDEKYKIYWGGARLDRNQQANTVSNTCLRDVNISRMTNFFTFHILTCSRFDANITKYRKYYSFEVIKNWRINNN